MQSNIPLELNSQYFDRQRLESALNNWREVILHWLRDEMREASSRKGAAEDGLALAFRNPGQVDEDVIAILWDTLESTSTQLFRLARASDRIAELDLAGLLVLFQRTTKLQTYTWEGDAWQLPTWVF